jgi:hypothetical protein
VIDTHPGNADSSDIVWGGADIAREINRNLRQTYHLLENHLLPARKMGRSWVSSKKALRAAVLPPDAP